MKTATELIDYIDHVLASLDADYGMIYDATRIVREAVSEKTRNRLDWDLVHMHTNLCALTADLKRHQEALMKDMNAGTTIQDRVHSGIL